MVATIPATVKQGSPPRDNFAMKAAVSVPGLSPRNLTEALAEE